MFDIRPWKMRNPEERYVDAAKELDKVVLEIIKENEVLKQENKSLTERINDMGARNKTLSDQILNLHKEFNNLTPVKVYHSKKRDNTTVKLRGGKSVTVKRMKGETDCLETAIAFALMKNMYPKSLIKELVRPRRKTPG